MHTKFIIFNSFHSTMNLLFICNQNKNRSKTAQEIFKGKFKAKLAGLYNNRPVTEKQLSWADIIIVMEDQQRSELAKRFPKQYLQKRILSLDIPDIYKYNDSKLVSSLKLKMKKYASLLS